MANIIKKENGYIIKRDGVPDVFLSNQDAFEVMEAVDRQYHLEDIRNKLEERESIDEEKVTEKEILDICVEYENRLEDDDSWSYMLGDIISGYTFKYQENEKEE